MKYMISLATIIGVSLAAPATTTQSLNVSLEKRRISYESIFAPYGDIGRGFKPERHLKAGTKVFSLAFGQTDCKTFKPVWGQGQPLDSQLQLVKEIRAGGGDVIISFGGALQTQQGSMPAYCAAQLEKSVDDLVKVYQSFIDMYQAKRLDFDVEGHVLDDKKSVKMRSMAIAKLVKANPGLKTSLTLPVAQSGLLENSIHLLKSAKQHNASLTFINIMAMNYGPAGIDMGKAGIDAAIATWNQIQQIGLAETTIGITPMLGVNDVQSEVFTIENAKILVEFAKKSDFVSFVSFWELFRDADDSFTKVFSSFGGNGSLTLQSPPSLPPSTSSSSDAPQQTQVQEPAPQQQVEQATDKSLVQPISTLEKSAADISTDTTGSCSVSTSPIHCISSTSFAQCAPKTLTDGYWVLKTCASGTMCREYAPGIIACS